MLCQPEVSLINKGWTSMLSRRPVMVLYRATFTVLETKLIQGITRYAKLFFLERIPTADKGLFFHLHGFSPVLQTRCRQSSSYDFFFSRQFISTAFISALCLHWLKRCTRQQFLMITLPIISFDVIIIFVMMPFSCFVACHCITIQCFSV